jgi:hypothetical protein
MVPQLRPSEAAGGAKHPGAWGSLVVPRKGPQAPLGARSAGSRRVELAVARSPACSDLQLGESVAYRGLACLRKLAAVSVTPLAECPLAWAPPAWCLVATKAGFARWSPGRKVAVRWPNWELPAQPRPA